MSLQENKVLPLKREDFVSDQEVRWCPGCGDYAILASVQKILPELGIARENTVFISGIGCSSRFPYYLNTYGFHTIHGRAPTIATGLKIARPELSVWIVTGDGDGLSIGANHLMHIMRRNLDVTILLFNNQIYGLTKGQYSPTSEKGKKTKTSPQGTIDEPFNPVQLALAAGCSFVARAIDVDAIGLQWVLKEAAAHRGTSFVEIYQNCNVFNDGAFAHISDRGFRAERTISLRPNQPLVFGQAEDKGLIYNGNDFVVTPLQSPEDKSQLYVHQVENDLSMAIKLNSLSYPEFPVPIGIFRKVERPIYEEEMKAQLDSSAAKQGKPSLEDLLHSGKTWTVK
ncbi:thiamine pyrophosphate-dependent enzyme [Candidatus Berkiella aquae]|uniref:2-oxoacid:ferredoxin oxidoreductase subunit beta n=1 Tax=Candidatus Berkiella aquae TaxID=295108 RepID=A0A0Q9YYF6_9GAMM|nr:2-oxoacid:ferredoxin oxidoreductase subunit beta [Candidatus Berkiella aquae]MCS5711838.1 2-oxoacid:ferredoxin oxidoreductase subunit beta [Candidatus Berkiella aquae]